MIETQKKEENAEARALRYFTLMKDAFIEQDYVRTIDLFDAMKGELSTIPDAFNDCLTVRYRADRLRQDALRDIGRRLDSANEAIEKQTIKDRDYADLEYEYAKFLVDGATDIVTKYRILRSYGEGM